MSAAGEAPEDLGIDAQDLEHLARAALRLCGLEPHEAILVTSLRGPGPLLLPDSLDLGAIWLPLTGACSVPPEQAARVVLLLQSYLGRNAQGLLARRPPRLPEETSAVFESVRAQTTDLDAQIPRMAQLAGELSAAGYTPPPPPQKEAAAPDPAAPRSSHPRLASLIGPLDPPMPVPTAAPPAARAQTPQKKSPPSRPSLPRQRLSFVGMLSAIVLVLLAGYWGAHAYYRLYLADKHTLVDIRALQVVMPIRDARVNRDTLVVITPDAAYAGKPPDEQTRLGRQLLAVLARPAVRKVTILSGDKQYRIFPGQRGSRMRVTPPQNPPGRQLGRQPGGRPGRQPGQKPGQKQPGTRPARPAPAPPGSVTPPQTDAPSTST